MVAVGFSAVFAFFLFSSDSAGIVAKFQLWHLLHRFSFPILEAQRGARKDGQANDTKSRRVCVCVFVFVFFFFVCVCVPSE